MSLTSEPRQPTDRRSEIADYFQGLAFANLFFLFVIVLIGSVVFSFGGRLQAWLLPLAALITLIASPVFSGTWRKAALVAMTFLICHCAAYGISAYLFDGSWDGLAYHQEAILRLAAGWNPWIESAGKYGHGQELWNDCFPKASWIGASAIFIDTGKIEAGKLFHLTLIIAAAAQVAATLLKLTKLKALPVIFLVALAAFNPVSIYQSTTFYVDGMLSSLFTATVAALVLYLFRPQWRSLFAVGFGICLMSNLKFTGLLYAVLILGSGILAIWYLQGFRSALRMAAFSAVTGAVAVLFLGYSPYVRNLREQGNIFYPMYGRNAVDFTEPMRPANVAGKDRITRFLIANFSRSEYVHPPNSTRLKFPFRVYSSEGSACGMADPEAGAFGPFYSGLLLLTAGAALLLLSRRETRQTALVPLLIAGVLLATIFSHTEGWWSRYAPQAWLLPVLVGLACWQMPVRSLRWWLGSAIVVVACANVLFVGYFFARHEWGYTRMMRRSLKEMAAAKQPVNVYLGHFRSLRERLRESGIKFSMSDTKPPTDTNTVWHDIPSVGQAVWSE